MVSSNFLVAAWSGFRLVVGAHDHAERSAGMVLFAVFPSKQLLTEAFSPKGAEEREVGEPATLMMACPRLSPAARRARP